MNWILLWVLSSIQVHAEEVVKTSIAPVMSETDDAFKIPNQIPKLHWDPQGIRVINRESSEHYSIVLKGTLSKSGIQSFAYQVEGHESKKITLKNGRFDVEIPLDRSPAIIRLWLETMEGKSVKIYSDLLKVRSEMISGDTDKKAAY